MNTPETIGPLLTEKQKKIRERVRAAKEIAKETGNPLAVNVTIDLYQLGTETNIEGITLALGNIESQSTAEDINSAEA